MRRAKLKQLAFDFTSMTGSSLNNKQLLDEVFVISRIIKFEVAVISWGRRLRPKAEADNPYRDLDYSGYRKNRIE